MPVKSKIVYDPTLSVQENAAKSGVSVNAIRYYIRTRGIDRRYHGKVNVVEELKAYLKEHPNATRAELSRETGHGINTIRRYWEIAHGNGMLMPNEDKTNHLEERRIKRLHKKHIAYLDKLPIEFICEYLKERKSKERKEQIRKEQEEKKKPVINELKDKIDALLEVECENTRRLEQNPSYLPTPTKQDLYKREKEVYNVAEHYCVAFRSKNDLWKGMRIPFGNMNGGYPYKMHGVEFPTSEHAYIFGLFSNNTPEHIAIQRELLSEPNGYNAKKIVRKNNRRQHRADWWEFNLEWMLYCVWEKANQCSEFRELLMAIPEGATIIEDGSFQKVNKSFDGVSYWGARNPEKRAFGKLAREYAKSLELNTQKATDEVEDKLLWDYCNVGTYTGNNIMGKILTIVKQCLHDGTQPDIDYELLKSKNIYFLGNLIGFDSTNNDNQLGTFKQQTTPKGKPKKASDNIKCTDKYAYFFQNTPLSNWWASNPRIPYDGHEFGSSEALFMYLKAKGLGDDKVANEILALDDNTTLTDKERFAKAQELGRKCKFDEEIFLANREKWMYIAISAKYEVDEEFRSVLMSEKYKGLTFVEASPRDKNWGIGLSATKACAGEKWDGLNLLGKLLTQLRDERFDGNS